MAFTITAYTFSKRINSTKQPTGLTGTDYSVVLKDRTSYENPVFLLSSGTLPTFNYVQWGTWYYFVDDIVIERNDLYNVKCSLDVLATYKTEIGATAAFVLYDTTSNTEIPDTRLSNKTSTSVSMSYAPGSFNLFEASETVIVGIVGQNSTAHWAMTPATARSLLAGIDTWMNNISLKWPSYNEPDPDPDPDDSESEDPGSNSDDPGNGPGVDDPGFYG